MWFFEKQIPPFRFRIIPGRIEKLRHIRKYAEGELGRDRSFYFRGPDKKLNLRAQNLSLFIQMAEGVDDETWLYHLHRGDYSQWFREAIKDEILAESAQTVEQLTDISANQSLHAIKTAIEQRYTLPS